MSDPGTVGVFAAIVLAALVAMSWILWYRAEELGHPPGRVRGRLILLWVCAALDVSLGLFLRGLFPAGLFEVSLTRAYDTPWFTLSGRDAGVFLVVGLAAMAICALLGLWAVNSLQRPPAGQAPEPPPDEGDAG